MSNDINLPKLHVEGEATLIKGKKTIRQDIKEIKEQLESLTHIVTVMNRNCACRSVRDDENDINLQSL